MEQLKCGHFNDQINYSSKGIETIKAQKGKRKIMNGKKQEKEKYYLMTDEEWIRPLAALHISMCTKTLTSAIKLKKQY